jgi:hypothetical protein
VKARHALAGTLITLAAAACLGGTASAGGPRDSCAAAASGWNLGTVGDVAHTVWEGLLDPSPWADEAAFTAEIAGLDLNHDGNLCLAIRWGERPSIKAHWYGIEWFIIRDN